MRLFSVARSGAHVRDVLSRGADNGVSPCLGPVRLWKISEKRRVDQHKRMQLTLGPRWLGATIICSL